MCGSGRDICRPPLNVIGGGFVITIRMRRWVTAFQERSNALAILLRQAITNYGYQRPCFKPGPTLSRPRSADPLITSLKLVIKNWDMAARILHCVEKGERCWILQGRRMYSRRKLPAPQRCKWTLALRFEVLIQQNKSEQVSWGRSIAQWSISPLCIAVVNPMNLQVRFCCRFTPGYNLASFHPFVSWQ